MKKKEVFIPNSLGIYTYNIYKFDYVHGIFRFPIVKNKNKSHITNTAQFSIFERIQKHFMPSRQGTTTSGDLKESQSFLQSILNSTHYGIASYEAIRNDDQKITDFKIVYTNAEVPGNFGLQPQNVIGKTCSEVYPGIFNNGIFEKLVDTMETGNPEKYEISVTNPDGNRIWLTAGAEKVNNTVTVTSKNITEEKNTEIQLQEMNRLLQNKNRELEQQILHEFSESFSSFKTGKDFFDSLLLELFHKTKMDYLILGEIEHGENNGFIKCFSVSAFGKVADNFTYPLQDGPCIEATQGKAHSIASGSQRDFPDNQTLVDLHIEGYVDYPLFDLKGKPIGLIAAMHQTEIRNTKYILSLLKIAAKRSEMELERQRNEKVLEEKNMELERKNKELESFNYIASHDLQEPLRKIQLFYSRVLEKDKHNLSESSLEYFASISSAADRMQNLIEALLSYSTTNFTGMVFEKTDLNDILADVKSDLGELIESKNASIESDVLPKLSVIPFQFRQLLTNLISNGIKYSKKDIPPIITITSAQSEEEGKKFWKIAIADNGIGFEQQYEHKIFELFQRLHGKNEFVGTGIGLAICKKIIENHKGRIEVQTEPGIGSVFTIFVPMKA
jgi:signal transduction histidine kinase